MLIDLALVLVSGAICFYLGRKTTILPFFETSAAWQVKPNAETSAAWQKKQG